MLSTQKTYNDDVTKIVGSVNARNNNHGSVKMIEGQDRFVLMTYLAQR